MKEKIKFDLDTPLIRFSNEKGTKDWTLRQAILGVQIFGGIGSGKTSSSGRTIATKLLEHQCGGLVLTAKAEERKLWEQYCRQTNRLEDLIIVEPGSKNFFNLLEYESTHKDSSVSYTQNIVDLLNTVIRSSEEKSGGKSDDPFWETSQAMLVHNIVDLAILAYGRLTIQQLYSIALTAPRKDDVVTDKPKVDSFAHAFELAQDNINRQIEVYEESLSPAERVRLNDRDKFEKTILEAIPDAALLKSIDQFFVEHFRNLSEKTRSIIEFSFSGFLFGLMKDPVYSLFCKNKSNYTPEDCLDGKIILIDLPVKKYHKAGRDCQVLFKYCWQRAMERRNIEENERPVFLYADESQHFLHPHDSEYQATARSSRIITVYISQNVPNYHANMGGIKSEYRVRSFLGTLGTKIFHANADIESNRYASDLIGEAYFEDESDTFTMSGKFSSSHSKSWKLGKIIRPEQLISLRTGGTKNNFLCDAYVHLQGDPFPDGQPFSKITFSQT